MILRLLHNMPSTNIHSKACHYVNWRICDNNAHHPNQTPPRIKLLPFPDNLDEAATKHELTTVRNDLADKLLLLRIVVRADLGRKRKLLGVVVLVHNHDVDVVRLALEHPCRDALLAQPDCGLLDLVQKHSGNRLVDL